MTSTILALALLAEAATPPPPRLNPPELSYEQVKLRLLEDEKKDIRNSAIALTSISLVAYGGAAALAVFGTKEFGRCEINADVNLGTIIKNEDLDIDLGCKPGKVLGLYGGAGAVSLFATGFLTASIAQWVRFGVRRNRIKKLRKSL